jgi:hypothetical protein
MQVVNLPLVGAFLRDRCTAGQPFFFFGDFLGFGVQKMQLILLWSWH